MTPAEAARALCARSFEPCASWRELVQVLGAFQYDPMSVVADSADLCFMARLDDYATGRFFAENGQELRCFETYHHNTFFRPITQYADYAPMREAVYAREGVELERRYPQAWKRIVTQVRECGPSTVAELDDGARTQGHWGNRTSLASLLVDIMVQCGCLIVARRARRQKIVDLPERVVPEAQLRPRVSGDAAVLAVLRRRIWFLGFASPTATMAEVRALKLSKSRKNALWDQLSNEPDIDVVEIAGHEYLADHRFLERYAGSRAPAARPEDYRLLSPFDPLISDRDMVRAVFGLSYTFEGYKPKRQRRYGGYTMPVAHRGDLIGRVELARANNGLTLARAWPETDMQFDRQRLDGAVTHLAAKLAADAA